MSMEDAAPGACCEDSALGSVLSDPRFTARLKRQQAQCEGGESRLDQLFAQKKKEFKPSVLESALAQRLAAQRDKAEARESSAKVPREEAQAPVAPGSDLAQRWAAQREKASAVGATAGKDEPEAKNFKSQVNPELAKLLERQRRKIGTEGGAREGKVSEATLRQLTTPSRRRSTASGSPTAKDQPAAAQLPALSTLPTLPREAPAASSPPAVPPLPLAPAEPSAEPAEPAASPPAASTPLCPAGPPPATATAATLRRERYRQASPTSAGQPSEWRTPRAVSEEAPEAEDAEAEDWETPRSEQPLPSFVPPAREASACGCTIA